MNIRQRINNLFVEALLEDRGGFIFSDTSKFEIQPQTNDIFSGQWTKYSKEDWEKQGRLFDLHSEEGCHSGRFSKRFC